MREDTSRYAILGMLTIRPMSGYDIKRAIGESIAHFWDESYGRIYPTLERLAAEGFVVARTERHGGRPDRRVYALTPKGRNELRRWLALPAREQKPRSELLLKLFFGRQLPFADRVRHIERVRQTYLGALDSYRALENAVKNETDAEPDQPYWLITLRFGQHRSRAIVEWCDETLRSLPRDTAGARKR